VDVRVRVRLLDENLSLGVDRLLLLLLVLGLCGVGGFLLNVRLQLSPQLNLHYLGDARCTTTHLE
jgi:hypothetical protein